MGSTQEFFVQNWYLIAAALVSGGLLALPSLRRGAQGGGVSPAEAVRLINREKAVVVDVCEPAEYAAGHVVGARSVPLDTLEKAGKELPSNKTLPLVVVCASGARANKAAALLRQRGHENVQVLAGGMRAWREANLPVETSKA
ncbi:rhodanese-like domain-containing protein [Ideonella azotifigens]|uniref:Rhodanese-like domain-containing protein n=1 Tax=Ideonella azotifigens TaxID=513160 RepID=A0ABP3VSC5_9BURK|nr:rhodanese-like domain-containing protein [Ideonella azotifigens]MCD2339590.1 rhodanese-like domain-containing protein [Ideonella azotifigens]